VGTEFAEVAAASILAVTSKEAVGRMDQVVGILIHIVLDIIIRSTGQNVLKLVGLRGRSERIETIVGSASWAAIAVAAFVGIRSLA
jgi:hypothetical protein